MVIRESLRNHENNESVRWRNLVTRTALSRDRKSSMASSLHRISRDPDPKDTAGCSTGNSAGRDVSPNQPGPTGKTASTPKAEIMKADTSQAGS